MTAPTGLRERDLPDAPVAVQERVPTGWDVGRRQARPILIAAVIGALVFTQARAHYKQYLGGFRLFQHEPSRVAFSWDMFAVRISRCNVTFDPPLSSEDGKRAVATFADLSPTIEWNPVFNDILHYNNWGRHQCARYARPGERHVMKLVCFDHTSNRSKYEVYCP
jgi:hypothetical protein